MPTNSTPTPATVAKVTVRTITLVRNKHWSDMLEQRTTTVVLATSRDGYRIEEVRAAGETPHVKEFATRQELESFVDRISSAWGVVNLLEQLA